MRLQSGGKSSVKMICSFQQGSYELFFTDVLPCETDVQFLYETKWE